MPTEHLREEADLAEARVAANVIRGVKLLGRVSKNARDYPPETMRRSVGLYEDRPVNLGHTPAYGFPSYRDRVGRVKNTRATEQGIFGDLHVNPKSEVGAQLLWDAANNPGAVQLSHDVTGETVRRDGRTVVESITSVRSVDLVCDGATTRTLFESRQHETEKTMFDFANFAEAIRKPDEITPRPGPCLVGDEALAAIRERREQRAAESLRRMQEREHPADLAARTAAESEAGPFRFDDFAGSIRQ